MAGLDSTSKGRKRKHIGDGKFTAQSGVEHQSTTSNHTPPAGQRQPPSSKASAPEGRPKGVKKQKRANAPANANHIPQRPQPTALPAKHPHNTNHGNKNKMPRLPKNASITKRPLHHPAAPTPFSSSASPKTIYMTASTPFIPAVKRIRRLLTEISSRAQQSAASNPRPAKHMHNQRQQRRGPLQANGRLMAEDVEREIADSSREKGAVGGTDGAVAGEEVFVKATGRAIPRALEVGNWFQGESDCRVRVEMGSVSAIDDIEVETGGMDAEGEEDVPETRIRTLSSVTVAVGLS